ncbi:MAG TPA: histone deacetylase [bacterium]|jgi:acetoin utilization deacetylase AcuC-like enzyme
MYPDHDNFTAPEFEDIKYAHSRIAVYSHEDFIKHHTGHHPENSNRLLVSINAIKENEVNEKIDWMSPEPCDEDDILRCHTSGHLKEVKRACDESANAPQKMIRLDPDTVVCPSSYSAATRAVGALCQGVDLLLGQKEYSIVWGLVRPPGHHAVPERSMGFCLFNNAACAAEYARANYGVERVMIIDFDAHHGNGTQDIFYSDPGVLYTSIHQSYHYPGTGHIDETGNGKGRGYNVNFPVLAGAGNDTFSLYHKEVVAPIAIAYKPQLIIVSAGFDAHIDDPLCMLQVTTEMFGQTTCLIRAFANDVGAPVIFTLEGGYNLEAMSDSLISCLEASTAESFCETDVPMRGRPSPGAVETLDHLREVLKSHWDF